MFKNRLSNSFIHHVLILSSGAALAQALPLLASPILTRLYTPEDFGSLAIIMALVSSVIPAVTGKYEVAMILPELKSIALELFALSFWFSLMITSVFFLFLFIFQEPVLHWLNASELGSWILLAPILLYITGLFNLNTYLANRYKNYPEIAYSKLVQAIIMVSTNLILGLFHFGFTGLLLGNLLGLMTALLYLGSKQSKLISQVKYSFTKQKISIARRYQSYPIYSASSGLLNGFTLALPIFYISAYYSIELLGAYALVLRMISGPLSLISFAVSNVYLKAAVDEVRIKKHALGILKQTMLLLLIPALLVGTILTLWGDMLFVFIFGQQWRIAGEYTQILAIPLSIRFIASTLSSTFGATNNTRLAFIRRIISFVFIIIALWISTRYASGYAVVYAVAISYVLEDIIAFILIYKAALTPRGK